MIIRYQTFWNNHNSTSGKDARWAISAFEKQIVTQTYTFKQTTTHYIQNFGPQQEKEDMS